MPMPPREVHLDETLVQRLVQTQHPDLGSLEVSFASEGWDFAMFRVGDELAARLPRVRSAAELLLKEREWMPRVAGDDLAIALPRHLREGAPTPAFDMPWAIVPWIPGVTADRDFLDEEGTRELAMVLRALHRPAPVEAPANAFRQNPLAPRREGVERELGELVASGALGAADRKLLESHWTAAIAEPVPATPHWIHADLHARNVLVDRGRLAGIIDWADLTAGDPATDLAAAWLVLKSPELRAAFFDTCRATPSDQRRAAGWAVYVTLALLNSGEAEHEALGRTVLRRLAS